MKLAIGYSDFKKIIDQKRYFADKSKLIAEIIDDAEVILITRPRRFGKTLNLSMLRYFFEFSDEHKAYLFENLNISKQASLFAEHQGRYPVINLSFKDVKESSYEAAYDKMLQILTKIYDSFSKTLLDSNKLTSFQKDYIHKILEKSASQAEVEDSIYMLSQLLHNHYDRKILILIDEYDTAIQSGYLNGYYEKITGFFRNLFSAALKDNPYLFKAVLTGILRISRESLFSGLNNLTVYSMLNPKYGDSFGLTEKEVVDLLTKSGLDQNAIIVKDWYNGYQVGEHVLYNPWSILNYLQTGGNLKPYWINTSDNALIQSLLLKSSQSFKEKFEHLLQGKTLNRLIDENFVFQDFESRGESSAWNLLLMTGYLKSIATQDTDQGSLCELAIPNREVRNLYRNIIEQWLSGTQGIDWYNQFLNYLLEGNIVAFEHDLKIILEQTISYHDVGKEAEVFYHGFILGITASLAGRSSYEIRSNRESSYGRYDYIIISHTPEKPTILFEFKTTKDHREADSLEKLARKALQ